MATTHKPFREIVKAGSNFQFIGKTRLWVAISIVAVLASIAVLFVNKATRGDYMNWSTDFKGGTELIFKFVDKGTGHIADVDAGKVRAALGDAGFDGVSVSAFALQGTVDGQVKTVHGTLIRTPAFGAVPEKEQKAIAKAIPETFKAQGAAGVTWSGDRLFVRANQVIDPAEMGKFLAERGLEIKPWSADQRTQFSAPEAGTNTYNMAYSIRGIDRQVETALDKIQGIDAQVVQAYGVGPKAGERLRNDGITSLFYAMLFIMLYLIYRFDIRYAPGAVIALLHDSILVIGVFAATWTEFSLTTVAAILTVIGYSVNDTVIIFDRIRENVVRLKDKKLARITNISINETLGRTVMTSLATFVTTLAMNIFGSGLVKNFAFAMNVGIIVGTYSSIFIASPIMLAIHRRFYGNRPKRGVKAATP